MIKGANGISDFNPIFFAKRFGKTFCSNITIIEKPAPIQKAITIEETAPEKPSKAPTPNANLASPKPIQKPLDTTHKKAKGKNAMIGAKRSYKYGKLKDPNLKVKNRSFAKESTIKVKTKPSGMTLCLMSYTKITIKILNTTR